MIHIDWNPVAHLGPIPINWYGLGWAAANSDRLAGALIVTIAAVSTAEVIRAFRFLNVLMAVWIAVGSWALAGGSAGLHWNDVMAGVMVFALTIRRDQAREHYAGWDRFVA